MWVLSVLDGVKGAEVTKEELLVGPVPDGIEDAGVDCDLVLLPLI